MDNISFAVDPAFQKSCYNAVKAAHKEFNAPSVSVDEYAKLTNQDRHSASELDFNSDDRISIWERASELVAKKYFCAQNEIVPSMLANLIYTKTDLSTSDIYNTQKAPTCALDIYS